ncbi:MAG TPA: bacteriohemerythrin [Candidatus Eisenbergiella merdipullorum]|uniref:Bacteriohemerythrin n=1 Tax=Candidatus Eisenbergiella merdipullorum TaxID=2838553 RepID=A0A9D2I867_9FIRM|nr:bacteriohemerythrin [Candidatus Eisenbergiella merdipullorum]
MAYQFTKDLETGNTLIDTEHRKLINAINALLDACSQGKGRSEIKKTMDFLQAYTDKHFSDEEALQRQSGYPGYAAHKTYHETFKRTVSSLAKRLDQEGPSVAIVGEINHALADWFINHIKTQDVKVAAHIRNVG